MKGYLEKIKVNKGHSSSVRGGHGSHGELFRLVGFLTRTATDPVKQIAVKDLREIEVGDMMFVASGHIYDFIKTSPIKEILDVTEGRIDFVTDTSTYAFEVEHEDGSDVKEVA